MTISVWYHTFGCKANQYDTERMRQELESRGAATLDGPDSATVAVLNTCTVTDQADLSARRLIRKLRRRHPDLRIVVAGCSSALKADEYAVMPEVDGVVAGQDPVAVAAEVAPESTLAAVDQEPIGGVLLRSNRRGSRGWMKIQDGCDRRCSFCATRIARGVSRSRSPDELVAEARLLSESHTEIVLTGIHIGHYGLDLEPRTNLAGLCRSLLNGAPGVRFRLGSIEATEIDDDLVDLLAGSEGLMAPHLHVPLQSGSDEVLRRMRRWHTREQYRHRVLEIADRVRPLGLGADIIVGFPGETEADHARTRSLVAELPYTYLHVFPYSVRAGTHAADLPGRVPAAVAAERSRELRELGVAKGSAHAAKRAGSEALVAVETENVGLTGDYLRVKVVGPVQPGTLVRTVLSGPAADLRVSTGATGRSALPLLAASTT
ncbi:MAG: MiaB/RimO family radical SAM methylthiotransferase [Gemmatimonadetes bacterium]|nr:MiaB/RimO family radical SAM methylthiotransferase [Gemmatimonadota bacterium]